VRSNPVHAVLSAGVNLRVPILHLGIVHHRAGGEDVSAILPNVVDQALDVRPDLVWCGGEKH
jgi:hypothetical protein